jgi:hypothetical protein
MMFSKSEYQHLLDAATLKVTCLEQEVKDLTEQLKDQYRKYHELAAAITHEAMRP